MPGLSISRYNVPINLQTDTTKVRNWHSNARHGPHPLGLLPPQPDNPKARVRLVGREHWMVAHALRDVQRSDRRTNDGRVDEKILAKKAYAPPTTALTPAYPQSAHFTCRPLGRYAHIKARKDYYYPDCDWWRTLSSVKFVLAALSAANSQDVTVQRDIAVRMRNDAVAAANLSQQAAATAQQAQGSAELQAQNIFTFAINQAQVQATAAQQMVAFLQNANSQQLLMGGAPVLALLAPPDDA